MIVGVTLAEKEERAKQEVMQKALLGYDPEKWTKAKAAISDEEQLKLEYQSIDTILPTKGKHRFAQYQTLYEEAHAFLKHRKWAPVNGDMEVSGITWLELFVSYEAHGQE